MKKKKVIRETPPPSGYGVVNVTVMSPAYYYTEPALIFSPVRLHSMTQGPVGGFTVSCPWMTSPSLEEAP